MQGVTFYSKTFSLFQRNELTTETKIEILAVIMTMSQFRRYLYGWHFRLRTDHFSLKCTHPKAEPSHKVTRWLETKAEFIFTIEHRAGRLHDNADGLSKRCTDCQ